MAPAADGYASFWVVTDSSGRHVPTHGDSIAERLMVAFFRTRGAGHSQLMIDSFMERARDMFHGGVLPARERGRVPLMVFSSMAEAQRQLRGSEMQAAQHLYAVTTPERLERDQGYRGRAPLLVDNHVIMQMGEDMMRLRASQPWPVAVFIGESDAKRWISLHRERQRQTLAVWEVRLDPELLPERGEIAMPHPEWRG
jgi:hypothetical protein